MQHSHQVSSAEAQASAIESKQALLVYLRSGPKQLTIGHYLAIRAWDGGSQIFDLPTTVEAEQKNSSMISSLLGR
jgi:hypothetical protein